MKRYLTPKSEIVLSVVERAYRRAERLQFAADEVYKYWGKLQSRASDAFDRAEKIEESKK